MAITLTDFCNEVNNWFEVDKRIANYVVNDGVLDLDGFVQNGQYFRIVGSVFNDGAHQYPVDDLTDETFRGAVWAMAVPPEVETLVSEINDWVAKYAEHMDSPYSSESFGGYSYTKAVSANGSADAGSWQNQFSSRLNRWRKIRP